MSIQHTDYGDIISTDKISFTYLTKDSNPRQEAYNHQHNALNWTDSNSNFVGKYIIHPFGNHNNLPTIIKNIVQQNYIAPGLLRKKAMLLWGAGPILYKEEIVNNNRTRTLVNDTEIEDWLDSWDYLTYIMKCCEDYQYTQGVFTKIEQTKGLLVGKPFIHQLEHIPADRVRLASINDKVKQLHKATHAIVGDFAYTNNALTTEDEVYKLFDFRDPFAYANSVHYSNFYSFCSDFYSVPEILGSLEWLNRSTAVPLIFKAMSLNSLNLKFHIESPQSFWDEKEKEIRQNVEDKGIKYTKKHLTDFKNEYLLKIAEVLSGDANVGKFLHTTKNWSPNGKDLVEQGWTINVIDNKVTDFVDAQIKISERSDQALSASLGLGQSIANTASGGNVNSGSEQYYSLLGYLNTMVDIPEMIVLKTLNYAIKANFPTKKLKIGFTQNVPEQQSEVNPEDRMKNQNLNK